MPIALNHANVRALREALEHRLAPQQEPNTTGPHISVKRSPASAMMYETPVISMPPHISSDPTQSVLRPVLAFSTSVSAGLVWMN